MQIKTQVADTRIARAKGAANAPFKTRYRLGKGGFDPHAEHPADSNHLCDCTGSGAWIFQVNRDRRGTWWTGQQPWKGSPWFESTNVYRDATSGKSNSVFVRLPKCVPGCGLVYPDGWKPGREGHFAVVTRVDAAGKVYGVDCATGKIGSAISERKLNWMLPRGAIPVAFRQDLV